MSAFSEKPGLREQMITALAGSQMTPVEGRECPLDRIAAFGAAQIARPDRAGSPPSSDPVQVVEARRVGSVQAYASCAVDTAPPAASAPVASAPPLADASLPAAAQVLDTLPARATSVSIDALPVSSAQVCAPGVPAISIEPDLAAMLLRLKYLEERSLAAPAVRLFARVLPHRYRRGAPPELLAKVAEHAIAEWIAGTCPGCRGTGRRGATMGGMAEKLVPCRTCERVDGKPSGMARVRLGNQVMARVSCPTCCGRRTVVDRKRVRGRAGEICQRCSGTGHFLPREVDRAEAIGVTPATYRKRWASVFDAALRSARALDRRLMGSVREQLGRDLATGV